MNNKYSMIALLSMLTLSSIFFAQDCTGAPFQDSFTVNVPSVSIHYFSGINRVDFRIGTESATISSLEFVQVGPALYHMRHTTWKDFYWKIDTDQSKIYHVSNGSFGKQGGTAVELGNVQVFGNQTVTNSMVINLLFQSATLRYDPVTDYVRFALDGDEITARADWEIARVEPDIYNLKFKAFNLPSLSFWKIDIQQKKMIRVKDGIFGNLGGEELPYPLSVRIVPSADRKSEDDPGPVRREYPSVKQASGRSESFPEQIVGEDIGMSEAGERPKSEWIDSEKALSRELLKHDSYDILVVPFQVQGYAFDRIGRSLMTRYLSDRIESSTELRIPGITQVSRSLGESARRFPDNDVYQLANNLKVRILLKGYIGHDRKGKMQFTLLVQSRDERGRLTSSTPVSAFQWKDIPFSDERLPSEVFCRLLDDIMTKLPIKQTRKLVARDYKDKNLLIPDTVRKMVTEKPESPLVGAFYLQLLGSLYPEETAPREELFERSLVALKHVSSRSPDYALLKARAYSNLYRRPAAVAELKTPSTPEEKALTALLNGNLTELEKLVDKIKRPVPRLLAQLELNDLHWSYGNQPGAIDCEKKILHELPGWKAMLAQRLRRYDVWQQQSNLMIKLMMDEFFPLPDFSADTLLLTNKALGQFPVENDDIDFSVYNHYHKYLGEQGQALNVADRSYPDLGDFLDVLYAIGESNLLKNVRTAVFTQALPTEAIRLLDRYERIYRGHPQMTMLRAQAMFRVANTKQGQIKDNMIKMASSEKYNACYWLQGQMRSGGHYCSPYEFYSGDFPTRSFWHPNSTTLRSTSGLRNMPESDYVWKNVAQSLQTSDKNTLIAFESQLRYTNDNIMILENYYNELCRLKLEKEAVELLVRHRDRFVGNPRRTALLVKIQENQGQKESPKKAYEQAIADTPNIWEPYEKLGNLYIAEGDFKKAAAVFRQYPPFSTSEDRLRDSNISTVGLSNYASRAGFNLLRRGAIDEAIFFLTLSKEYETGSGGSMMSSAALALLKKDYAQAARETLELAKRYNDNNDYEAYMVLLHCMSYHREAWSLYDSRNFDKYLGYQWSVPFVGHRVEGRTDEEVLHWLLNRPENGFVVYLAQQKFVLLTHLIDRAPNEKVAAIADEIYRQRDLAQTKGIPLTMEGKREIENIHGPYTGDPRTELAWFATGYFNLKIANYAKAFEVFNGSTLFNYKSTGYALPYAAWAACKTGKGAEVENYLNKYENEHGKDFEYYLAGAFLAAGRNDHKKAIELLRKAQFSLAGTGERPLYVSYELVEACEWLYQDSKYSGYKDIAVNLAKLFERIYPEMGWAYAVEAKYSDPGPDRTRALALTLYLDRRSERISGFSDQEKKKALEWLEKNNPFQDKISEELKLQI